MPAAIKKKKDAVAAANERGVDKTKSIEVALKKIDGEVIFGKRKRDKSQAELNAEKWVDENFEEKVDYTINRTSVYCLYTKCCAKWKESSSIERPVLLCIIKERFPKGYALKKNSPYRGKVMSMSQLKKQKRPHKPSIKLAEVVISGLEELGNPKSGVPVYKLKRLLDTKYPTLCLIVHPKPLQHALKRLVQSGHLERVRGMGLSGYYRLDKAESEEEETLIKKKKDSDESDSNSEDVDKDATGSNKDKKKRKHDDGEDEVKPAAEKKAKKPQKAKIMTEDSWLAINHSEPQRIEDTFPLAFTFMSEPKTASVMKIKKYLAMYYPYVAHESIIKALGKGVKRGYWVHRGSSYELTITSFNPSDSKDTYDMICQAIVACHEPKKSSMKGIKQYIQDYHEDFNVLSRKFRMTVERSLNKGILRQVTGLGLNGSFELNGEFIPSPAMLAGVEDTDVPVKREKREGYKPRSSSSRSKDSNPLIKQELFDEMFDDRSGDLYVPRPSFSRGGQKPSRNPVTSERKRDLKRKGSKSRDNKRGDRNKERKSHKRRNEKKRKLEVKFE